MIGRQLSRNTVPGGLAPLAFSASHAAYSRLWNVYFDLGNVGTQRPLRNIVFQPVWSMCRWVQNTCVMSSNLRPAAAKPSSQGFLGKSIGGGNPLSSPVQVSISTVCLGVRTTNVW